MTAAPDLPAAQPRKNQTVYECPEYENRLLGSQLCENCRTFMRRLGAGGTCPCGSEPVTFDELLDA